MPDLGEQEERREGRGQDVDLQVQLVALGAGGKPGVSRPRRRGARRAAGRSPGRHDGQTPPRMRNPARSTTITTMSAELPVSSAMQALAASPFSLERTAKINFDAPSGAHCMGAWKPGPELAPGGEDCLPPPPRKKDVRGRQEGSRPPRTV